MDFMILSDSNPQPTLMTLSSQQKKCDLTDIRNYFYYLREMEAMIFSIKKFKYELYFGKLEKVYNFELQRILNKRKIRKQQKKE